MKPYYRVYSNESNAAEQVETLADAKARAEELAAKHPGRAFEILKCVGISQTSKASTFWMDGEEPTSAAPEKKYRMLKRGEIIHSEDEYSTFGKHWIETPASGEIYSLHHFPHRRPL